MNLLVRKEAWKEKNLTGKWKNLYTPIGLGRLSKKRLRQNLTQDELGERIGVQKAQISRMERGYSISIPTMSRVFKALGINTATLDLGACGKVALW